MAEWPYNTANWRRLRAAKLSEQPICEFCERRGMLREATVVDHIKAIRHGGDAFPELSGLMSLCASCHASKTNARDNPSAFGGGGAMKATGLDGLPIDPHHPFVGDPLPKIDYWPTGLWPSLVPLTIICGAPASGKSTYIAEHAGDEDTIIDLDAIASELSGQDAHGWDKSFTGAAIARRNEMLRDLGRSKDRDGEAWFIVSASTPKARAWWSYRLRPRDIIVLETPADVCIERIRQDITRRRYAKAQIHAVEQWWKWYARRSGERPICPLSS